MRRVVLFAVCAFAALAMLSGAILYAQEPVTTTVVLVRHAEAVSDAGRDPMLSEAGRARALALAAALKDAGVAAVYATQYQRTRMTGSPVAEAAGLQVYVRPIEGETNAYADALVKEVLAAHAGRTIVIVGHSNTVPALVNAFGSVDPGEIAHDSYDSMFIVTTSAPGMGRVVRARYGASR